MHDVARRVHRQIKPLPLSSDWTHLLIHQHHTIPSRSQLFAHLPRRLASARYFFNYALQTPSGWFAPALSLDPPCDAPIAFSSLNMSSYDLFTQLVTDSTSRILSSDKTSVTVTTTKPLHLPDTFFAFTSLYNCSMTIPLHIR